MQGLGMLPSMPGNRLILTAACCLLVMRQLVSMRQCVTAPPAASA
jgi:hypothetical protein